MNLYLANGTTFVGTQAEARKLDKNFIPTVVPTDKEGLMAYLNEYGRFNRASGRRDALAAAIPKPAQTVMLTMPTTRDMSAEACLSRMDGPPDIDRIVETICTASGYPLKRFAGAVACAFNNLAKEG